MRRPARTSPRIIALLTLPPVILIVILFVFRPLGVSQAPAKSGDHLNGVQPAERLGRTFSIATQNIRSGRGVDEIRNLERIAGDLQRFDLVALNEVDANRRGNQAESLARINEVGWLFFPREIRFGRPDNGNGLLSKLPIARWESTPLPHTAGRGMRNVATVDAVVAGEAVRVILTHIDTRNDREAQLAQVIEMFLSAKPPAILLGDLNTRIDDPQIKKLLATPGVIEPLTASHTPGPPNQIDWIFARGLSVRSAGFFDFGTSDHPVVFARFELPEKPTTENTEINPVPEAN